VRVQFGDFSVDDETRQLRRLDRVVSVTPKAFDLLWLLIRERPRVITKAELHRQLWPEVFVSDGNLAMLVAELRAALGETARTPHFIRTSHRHGYAFEGDVRTDRNAAAAWLVSDATRWRLQRGDNVVGRDPASEVWIDAPSISRRHACIRMHDETILVEDLQSKNGTCVGDTRITQPMAVRPGDTLQFGAVRTTLHWWEDNATHTEGD